MNTGTGRDGKGKRKSGTKKYGRDIAKCAQYKSENRRLKNKALVLAKRLRSYKVQPPKMLKGLDPELRLMVAKQI